MVWDGLALAWRGEGMAVSSRYLYQVFLVVLCIVFILTSAFPFVFVWETHTHTLARVHTRVYTHTHSKFCKRKARQITVSFWKKKKERESATHSSQYDFIGHANYFLGRA